MTCARAEVVREREVGVYHCVHRCVRRAFLCGDDDRTGRCFDHRRDWTQRRLEELSANFAVEVCGFALLSNHMHVIVRVRPDAAAELAPDELALRWWRLFPKRREPDGTPSEPTPLELEAVLADRAGGAERVLELRQRLASVSWFLRCLAEWIARRANKEDGCTGRFWEGRFKAQALLDEQAVLSCSLYVDLNPVRAGVAATPEDSRFTAARERIEASQAREKLARLNDQRVEVTTEAQRRLVAAAIEATRRDEWLSAIGSPAGFLPGLTLARYLELLDWTGRQIAEGKRGVIPSDLAPILVRLAINVDLWIDTVTRFGRTFRRAAGSAQAMCAEALRVSRNWLQGISTARRAFRVA